jgi:hypothetical protein
LHPDNYARINWGDFPERPFCLRRNAIPKYAN